MRHLGEPFTAEETAEVIAAARSFLGAEWAHAKRMANKMDCLGMVIQAIQSVRTGFPQPPKDYGRLPNKNRLSNGLTEYLGPPIVGPWRFGDVAAIKWTGEENHVGIIVNHPDREFGLIHCDMYAPGSDRGRVIEHGMDEFWRRRIVKVWRP